MDGGAIFNLKIREINPHIVCRLCAGYFVDATTITECLHTFCKACIVKYLQTSKFCPTCNTKVHETQPLSNIKLDRTMQDIVNYIVPGLKGDEERRRTEFHDRRGIKNPLGHLENGYHHGENDSDGNERTNRQKHDFSKSKPSYRDDEQISLCVERDVSQKELPAFQVPSLQQKYLRCSVRAKCGHLMKLINKLIVPTNELRLEVICNEMIVPKDVTMKFIWLAFWGQKLQPMTLSYRYKKVDS